MHVDALGSLRLTTVNGSTLGSASYPAFGATSALSVDTTPNPYGWIGQFGYYDDSHVGGTALFLAGARWYDPITARWLSKDPIWPMSDENAYRYVRNRPTLRVDPLGLEPVSADYQKFEANKWFDDVVSPRMKKVGVPDRDIKAYRTNVLSMGCVAVATCVVAFGPKTTKIPLDNCYRTFDLADAERARMDKQRTCCKQDDAIKSIITGQTAVARIIRLQYSGIDRDSDTGKEIPDPTPGPIRGNRYNLEKIRATIETRYKPGVVNFDYIVYSTKNDPWFNKDLPWLHANEGQRTGLVVPKIYLSNEEDVATQMGDDKNRFNQEFYCVVCERTL